MGLSKPNTRYYIHIWQYYNQNDLYADILKYSNMGFTGMFSVETVLKIIAYGVKVSTQTLSTDTCLGTKIT